MKNLPRTRIPRSWILVSAGLLTAVVVYGVQQGRGVREAPSKTSPFNEQRADTDLRTLVGFGPRPAGSESIAKARSYIIAELKKAGLKPAEDPFDAVTPRGTRRMINIRAVRPGSKPRIIALTGHYDTKIFDFPFVGASDGGSSAAWLLEMARVTANLKLENTLEFVFLDGEEAVVEWTDTDSVYGSRFDVDRRYRAGSLEQLKALVLADMIGDKNLNIRKETQSTDWLKSIIWNTAQSIGYNREFPNDTLEVSDDHIPYLKAGIAAVDLIDFDYPAWHTAEDTLDKVSARSLKIVGDVVYLSLPEIDRRVSQMK
jgi:glutaminyl-peptide cyclotransferase